MIKMNDFANECGVTSRQVSRLINKYDTELTGLYERRGQDGTWLTDEACEILRSKMKTKPIVVGDNQMLRENERLQAEIARLTAERDEMVRVALDAKDKIIELQEQNAKLLSAEADVKLLQEKLDCFEPTWFGLYRKK